MGDTAGDTSWAERAEKLGKVCRKTAVGKGLMLFSRESVRLSTLPGLWLNEKKTEIDYMMGDKAR